MKPCLFVEDGLRQVRCGDQPKEDSKYAVVFPFRIEAIVGVACLRRDVAVLVRDGSGAGRRSTS